MLALGSLQSTSSVGRPASQRKDMEDQAGPHSNLNRNLLSPAKPAKRLSCLFANLSSKTKTALKGTNGFRFTSSLLGLHIHNKMISLTGNGLLL